MIKVEKIKAYNFEGAVRGMRNPMNSWEKSDSGFCYDFLEEGQLCDESCPAWKKEGCSLSYNLERKPEWDGYMIGKNDLELMQKLFKAGTEHRKFMRQIFVSMDITAPLYWWKEFDTYKVGTTANSCSTMHKIHAKEFELDDFSHEHLDDDSLGLLEYIIANLNECRKLYIHGEKSEFYEIKPKNKEYWWQMIQLLPTSYNQKRTVTMNYENAASMIKQRENHKLDEWREFVEVLKGLPYLEAITMIDRKVK